jgi:hypothetical protein
MNSLDYRRDTRTVEEFKKNIQEKTSLERKLLNVWIEEMKFRGNKVEVEDYGIDNSGAFVPLSSNRPDFELHINGKSYLYEVKQNTYSHRNSFKIYDLEQYIKMDARILLFYGINPDGSINKFTRWAIIQPAAMQEMLKLPKIKTDKAWGFKEIVVIKEKDFERYFKSYEFNYVR